MAGSAVQAGSDLKTKKPQCGNTEASEVNVVIYQENNVMANNSTAASRVIPFSFEAKEVRTILIDDQPWFFAVDVCASLALSDTNKALIGLDEDEKCEHEQYSGSGRKPILINESGLYSLILRSRKSEARRFKKWVTSEVLPAIRKTGRYEATPNQMTTLIGDVIGSTGEVVLDRVIEQKGYFVPAGLQRSFRHTMKSRLRSRFNVQRTSLIPAECLADACNFVAAYAIEGEYLGREEVKPALSIHYPIEVLTARREGMLTVRNSEQAWLDVTLHDLRDIRGDGTPLEKLLWELESAGFDISGAWWELRTYRNKLRELGSFVAGMGRVAEDPQRYAVDAPKRRAAA